MDNQGHDYRTKINIVLLILIIYTLYLIKDFLLYIGIGLGIVAIIGLSGYVIFHILIWRENYLTKKEEREKISREIVTTNDGKVIVRDNNPHSTWRQIHLNPNPYVNGSYEQPTEAQIRVFNAVMTRRKEDKLPLLIEGQVIEKQRTIFNIVDTGVHFALVGGTDAGKTTLANHIIDYVKIAETYVCDPHTKFNVWSNRAQIIRKYEDIEAKVSEIYDELGRRYDPDTPSVFSPILLAIDEYPKVARMCDISRMIVEISSEGRKVKIFLILMSQSDLVQDTNLNTAMQSNFVKIMLNIELTQRNEAYIRHWTKEKELITLAGEYQKQLSIEERIIDEWTKIDEWAKANEDNYKKALGIVAKNVYSHDGGNQRDRVKEVINGRISNEST